MVNAAVVSPYIELDRKAWGLLRGNAPLTLSEQELVKLTSINDEISLIEVETVYLPISRLLHNYVKASRELGNITNAFLDQNNVKTPFILGIAGSVSVGKSTTARVLQTLMQRWPEQPRVDLVTTDGFLFSNQTLEARGLLNRKGFPESYDTEALIKTLHAIKGGQASVSVPLYSHLSYDIIKDKRMVIDRPDILILEGLNVLQPAKLPRTGQLIPYVSDFFDFSIYLSAEEVDLERWYIERFMGLRETAFKNPESYFHRYATLDDQAAFDFAVKLWRTINLPNLRDNILPTRQRARLVLSKAHDHGIKNIALRRI